MRCSSSSVESDRTIMLEPSDSNTASSYLKTLPSDLKSGVVVALVALPLCLGIALASGAPLFSGVIAGIVGGIVVGALSGSHTSVSGPAAGLTTIVAAQIVSLGSFEAFLLAVVVAGVFQIVLGVIQAGSLSAFFPSSVIKGLLAAIGVILILKQIPHVLGHDTDPEGEMSFSQPDDKNTFTEIGTVLFGDVHVGAIVIGLLSIALLVLWDKWPPLKKSIVPGPLVVVLLGIGLNILFQRVGSPWLIQNTHLVQIPVATNLSEMRALLSHPDFSQWLNPGIYFAGMTIAIIASLETLLNLQAVDKLDTERRSSPPSRELWAQGAGNIVSGLLGGLPVTSVIVRGSVNVNSGSKTKLSAIIHGFLLMICVLLLPQYLNMIPLASLAAILLVTGFKLASPKLFTQMWREGRYQFVPFIITLVAIVLSDLLIGVLIGLAVSLTFILNSNLRRPIRRIVETHLDSDILHIELANQVSFLNRAALTKIFNDVKPETHVLIDASQSDYIDPDILSLIREYKEQTGPARGVSVSTRGFRQKYQLHDEILFADYSTRELQDQVTPQQVLELLKEGNRRFRTGERLSRDLGRQLDGTATGQNPLAVVISCIDSRVPAELVLDLGIGDIFSVRVAGNVLGKMELGSTEYGVVISGVKLVLVMGHTRCGAVTAAVNFACSGEDVERTTGCSSLPSIVDEIQPSLNQSDCRRMSSLSEAEAEELVNQVARRNVMHTVQLVTEQSLAIRRSQEAGQVMIVGAMYDVCTGEIEFMT